MKKVTAISTILLAIVLTSATLSSSTKATSLQVHLEPLIEDGAEPFILQDATNKIWVFFTSSRIDGTHRYIFYITSTDGGTTWSNASLFLPASNFPEGMDVAYGPVAYQDSTGRFWVAWLNHTAPHNADQVWFTTSNDGENWSPAKLLCDGHNDMGGFVEAEGKIWFFFSPLSSYWRVSYKTTEDGGNSWSDLVPITIDSGMRTPYATVLSNGTIFVVYRVGAYHYEANIGYSASSDGGLTWRSGVVDDPSYPEHDGEPRVIEQGGKIYVFFARYYEQEPPYTADICFRVWNKTNWENLQHVTDGDHRNYKPAPTFIDNQLWITFTTNRAGEDYYDLDVWLAVIQLAPPLPKQLSIELSGEHDYLPWENVKVKISALVSDVNTMEPVSGANVTITIYDPQNNLWIHDTMTEIPNTGVYTWESPQTARQIFIHYGKGIYTALVNASLHNAQPASDVLTFHIDPYPENNQLPTIIGISLAIIVIMALATVFIKKKRRHS